MTYRAAYSKDRYKYDKHTGPEANTLELELAIRKDNVRKHPPNGVSRISVEMRTSPAPRSSRGQRRMEVLRYTGERIPSPGADFRGSGLL